MALDITSIPNIMRHQGWHNAARLMEVWFSRNAAIAPAYSTPETHTIRLRTWLLTFPRASALYRRIQQEKIWCNPAAQKELATYLKRKALLPTEGRVATFGNLAAPAPEIDKSYVNQRPLGFSLGDLDDMTAALGNFVFRVAVAGTVTSRPKSRSHLVSVTEVGIYIRDSYDFNGSQFLGYWDPKDRSVSMINPLSGQGVSNDDFRGWRQRTGKGGDFLVFSDVTRIFLSTPDTFEIQA